MRSPGGDLPSLLGKRDMISMEFGVEATSLPTLTIYCDGRPVVV